MKYALLPLLLLTSILSSAQSSKKPESTLKYGVQLSTTGNILQFPIVTSGLSIIVEPNSRHRFVIGLSNAWKIGSVRSEPLQRLRLAYLYHLTNPEDKWTFDASIDTRNVMWGKTQHYKRYNEEINGIEAFKSNSTHYHAAIHAGLGATRQFKNQLSLSMAMGPSIDLCMNKTRFNDPDIEDGYYACLNYYFFTSVGLSYLIEHKTRLKPGAKVKKKKSECEAF